MAIGAHISPEAIRRIAGLAISCVHTDKPMLVVRAAQWWNALARVGTVIPFWAVHDIGMLCVVSPDDVPIKRRSVMGGHVQSAQSFEIYIQTLREIGESEVLETARQLKLSDDLIAILLLKCLAPLFERVRGGAADAPAMPLDPEVYANLDVNLVNLVPKSLRESDLVPLDQVAKRHIRLITAIEQIDLDTLKLLGMFGEEAGAANALNMVDLMNVMESPDANDVVNFSLDLLPSVLETKRASGQQSFSVDGYAGVSRSGTIDSLVLSELAFDPELFDRRFIEKEVFYYAREKDDEEERRLHYIVVDASASMRGQRSVFARGLALTLMKKLNLRGEDVYMRFFDSRLYDAMFEKAGRTSGQGISVPYVLTFKGERGRNYAKVFGLLVNELERVRRRSKRSVILYVLTHAQCHIPTPIVERLAEQARLYGVFMLPSTGELELEYLNKLHTVQVVDEASLNQRDERAKRALDIVEDAAKDELEVEPS